MSNKTSAVVKTNPRKAVMIGCGFVGSASVFALMQSGLFSEIVLIDADKDKAEGEAMDISHGIPFARPMIMMMWQMLLSLLFLQVQAKSRARQDLIW